jgi:hypothetical protein
MVSGTYPTEQRVVTRAFCVLPLALRAELCLLWPSFCSLHPSLAVLATGSGKRNFTSSMAIDSSDEDSNDEESADEKSDCSLKFWSVGPP